MTCTESCVTFKIMKFVHYSALQTQAINLPDKYLLESYFNPLMSTLLGFNKRGFGLMQFVNIEIRKPLFSAV